MGLHLGIMIVNKMHNIQSSQKNDKESKGPTKFIYFRAWLEQLLIRIQILRRLPRRGILHGVSMAGHRKCIGWMWRCGVSNVNGLHLEGRYQRRPPLKYNSEWEMYTHSPSGKRAFCGVDVE
jgi:hypothetical protein